MVCFSLNSKSPSEVLLYVGKDKAINGQKLFFSQTWHLLFSVESGLREGWTNATYDEETNTYLLECSMFYPTIAPDIIWVIPNGGQVDEMNDKYQVNVVLFLAFALR